MKNHKYMIYIRKIPFLSVKILILYRSLYLTLYRKKWTSYD